MNKLYALSHSIVTMHDFVNEKFSAGQGMTAGDVRTLAVFMIAVSDNMREFFDLLDSHSKGLSTELSVDTGE